jgi:hypothetical protein
MRRLHFAVLFLVLVLAAQFLVAVTYYVVTFPLSPLVEAQKAINRTPSTINHRR